MHRRTGVKFSVLLPFFKRRGRVGGGLIKCNHLEVNHTSVPFCGLDTYVYVVD